jgi:rhamnogalacturonyl hydrolase YesR
MTTALKAWRSVPLFAALLSGAGVSLATGASRPSAFAGDTPAVAGQRPAPLHLKTARRQIEPFDYAGVTIDGGLLRTQIDEVVRFYLAIPDDDLLKGFRARAGLPAPGKDLGGWYSQDVFHPFGQMLSGLSRFYAATGDTRCCEKVNHLLDEWAKCIAPDGCFFFSDHPFARHYIYDKMMWGLLDAHLYCQNTNALPAASRITDWAIKNLDRSRKVNDTACEWYTLSENLYRAWLITGDAKYRDFAEFWEYHPYWDAHTRAEDIFATRPDSTKSDVYHAYSHVNTLGGCGAAFLASGEGRYLAALTNAYDYFQRAQVFATGGFGPDEQLLPAPALAKLSEATHNSFETQCGSWAVFKFSKYLLSFTGDARFGGWAESLAFNAIGGTIPMTADGRVAYYADYNCFGARKRQVDIQWSCCTGTRSQAVADLHDLIYFKDAESLYVNLFVPSTLHWPRPQGMVTLKQRTQFPESDRADFEFELTKPARFTLKFRVPGWLAAPMKATVNGQPIKLRANERHWAELRRRWKAGDKVSLTMPMKLQTQSFLPSGQGPRVFTCGPAVLAFDGAHPKTLAAMASKLSPDSFSASPGNRLHFQAAGDPELRLRAYYEFTEAEPYFLFLDSRIGSHIAHTEVKLSGKWNPGGIHRFSNEAGATAEIQFDGTAIRWLGWRFDDGGIAEVSIDDQVVGTVDQFGPGRDLPFDWSKHDLAPGHHTLRIKVLPSKNPKSKNNYINLAGFEVLER